MPGTDSFGQGVNLALLSDAPDAQQLAADLAAGTLARSMLRYDSTAHRGTEIETPEEGMVTYLRDSNTVEYYSGSAWRPFYETQPKLPRGRVASKYSTQGPDVGTITATNLLIEAWVLAAPVLTTRRYRAHAAFTWISSVVGMSCKIWIGYVPSSVVLPGNGTDATEVAYKVATEPATSCNQYLACSGEFNGPFNGNMNMGVYATKYPGSPSGGFQVQSDPIELFLEDVGPAV